MLDCEKEFVHPLHHVAHYGHRDARGHSDRASKKHESDLFDSENETHACQLSIDAVAECSRGS
jgi:hypothetical protein